MITDKLIVRIKTAVMDVTERGIDDEPISTLQTKDPLKIVESKEFVTNGWDEAHAAVSANPAYSFAEPDVDASADFYSYQQETEERGEIAKDDYYKFINYWPSPAIPSVWHLGNDFSQLKKARETVQQLPLKKVVRIAHFDTGYDKDHVSFPQIEGLIRNDLQRNFVEGEEDRWNNAADTFDTGLLKMPGHGTGTLSILAGAKLAEAHYAFDDYFGLYDSIEIVPIRIAKSVVLFKASAFVKALDYVVNELYNNDTKRVHIITMSMGGVASAAWADMVNLAYERGIFIVSAAGNNFMKLPTHTMIYPARFYRVVAACGVTYDKSPYAKPTGSGSLHIMEGNYGPQSLMDTAIAAFTPNVPWATYRFNDVVGIRGDGTSSATPQIASAAALYYVKNYDALEALPELWMRVEAIRKALFTTAAQEINDQHGSFDNDYKKYYGNGILKAAAMLDVPVADAATLIKQQEDKVSFPLFRVLFGIKAFEEEQNEDAMLETELMQLVLTDPKLQAILHDEEKGIDDLNDEEKKQFATEVINNEKASVKLKQRMRLLMNQINQSGL